MENKYTDFSLIKFLYNDTTITEYFETEHAISENPKTAARFKKFKRSFDLLSNISLVPSALSVQQIKLYSQIKDVQLN